MPCPTSRRTPDRATRPEPPAHLGERAVRFPTSRRSASLPRRLQSVTAVHFGERAVPFPTSHRSTGRPMRGWSPAHLKKTGCAAMPNSEAVGEPSASEAVLDCRAVWRTGCTGPNIASDARGSDAGTSCTVGRTGCAGPNFASDGAASEAVFRQGSVRALTPAAVPSDFLSTAAQPLSAATSSSAGASTVAQRPSTLGQCLGETSSSGSSLSR